MSDEHLAAVLCIATSIFAPNTGKLVSSCKDHYCHINMVSSDIIQTHLDSVDNYT
jgi:hypothetical protein